MLKDSLLKQVEELVSIEVEQDDVTVHQPEVQIRVSGCGQVLPDFFILQFLTCFSYFEMCFFNPGNLIGSGLSYYVFLDFKHFSSIFL